MWMEAPHDLSSTFPVLGLLLLEGNVQTECWDLCIRQGKWRKHRLWETESCGSLRGNLGHLQRIHVPTYSTHWRQVLWLETLTPSLTLVGLWQVYHGQEKDILFLWGQRRTHFPLQCNENKGQSQSPLPRNTNSAESGTLLDRGEEGKHTSMIIHSLCI